MKGCEYFDNCSYFNNYTKYTKALEAWMRLFCMDNEKSENCERKKILNQTGESPPANMSPTGEMFEDT